MPSVYQELDRTRKETRLITIKPGSGQSDVHCLIWTISLSQKPLPIYETVSYVWGNAGLRGTVHVNDHKLDVPLSTEIVLRRMRHTSDERTVWIDSMCIDQTNMSERNYQVQLMCDIYSNTAVGLIWLGEDNGYAEDTFRTLHDLYNEAYRETDAFRKFKAIVWPGWWDTYGNLSNVKFSAERLAGFFDLPWFSRLWVVQEASLAPQSICYYGSRTMPLLLILRAAIWLYSKSKSSYSLLSGHWGLARAVHIASYTDELFETPFRTNNNLLWMLNTLKQYDTSRDEDHVYGLVGMYQRFLLSEQILPQRLVPDYAQSLKRVLCNATRLAIEELQTLDPLLYVCHRTVKELEHDPLPSWVPKWHRKQDLSIDHFPLNYKKFKASQDLKPWIQSDNAVVLENLVVEGFVLGTVENVTNNFSEVALHNKDQLRALLDSAARLLPKPDDIPGHLESTLVASLDHRMIPMSREQSIRGYNALIKHLSNESTMHSSDRYKDSIDVNVGGYLEALIRWMRNRRFFVTNLGHIGTGPQILQRGDLVAVLYGSGMPLILRQMGQTKSYSVVGQAYVADNMSGEAVEAQRRKGLTSTIFALI